MLHHGSQLARARARYGDPTPGSSKQGKKLPGRGRLGNRLETTQFSPDKFPQLILANRQSSHHATLEANKRKGRKEKGRLRYVDINHQREREPKKRPRAKAASTFLGTCSTPSQGLGVLFELMCRSAGFEAALTPICTIETCPSRCASPSQ